MPFRYMIGGKGERNFVALTEKSETSISGDFDAQDVLRWELSCDAYNGYSLPLISHQ